MRPLVSIVMPLYNCEDFIMESIKSVFQQTYENWELIIVDDGSTDQSYALVKRLSQLQSRIKLYRMKKNMGVASVRNYATKIAKGEYIAFLDCDDLWTPEKLEKQISFMQQGDILLSYTSYIAISKGGTQIGIYSVPPKVTYIDMLRTSLIGTLTMIYNAKELGKYYFENQGHEDYILKLQILKHIECAKGLVEPLAKYRISDNSLSRNKIKTALWQWNIYREHENLPLWKSFCYFIQYIYFGIKKYS